MTTSASDADLVAGHLAGDPAALAGIYDRYADTLHDTAAAMLNDRSEAADALQDVILVAAERLHQLRDPDRLKPWLFAILRNEVYRRTRERRRTIATDFSGADDGASGVDVADARIDDPGDAAVDDASGEDLAELVRNAARGLDERDQLVLELSVRQGLAGQDLADALGVSANQSYTLVHRMRDRVERSLGAFVVARAGRRDCDDLDQVLSSWDGEFSVLVRKRVARHIDQCDTCDRRRRTAVPFAMFAAAPVYAAPAALREQILGAAGSAAAGTPGAGTASAVASYRFDADGGFPGVVRAARGIASWVAPTAAAAVLLVAGAAVVMLTNSGDDQFATSFPQLSTTVDPGETSSTDAATSTDSAAPTNDATTTLVPNTDAAAAELETTAEISSTTIAATASVTPTTTIAAATTAAPATTTPPSTAPPSTTAPSTTAPPPNVAPPATPSTTTTTTTTTTTVPPTPGQLSVSAGAIDLGASARSGSVTVSNTGELPLDFAVEGSTGAFAVTPLSGSLGGGASVELVASIDRTGRREGAVPSETVVVSAGGASFDVRLSATVERPPTLSNARGSATCFPTNDPNANGITVGGQADIVDESSVTARLSVSGPTGQSGSSQMIPDGPTWFGAVNFTYPPNEPGTVDGAWTWSVTATDARGNSSTTSGSVTPTGC